MAGELIEISGQTIGMSGADIIVSADKYAEILMWEKLFKKIEHVRTSR